MYVLPNWLLTVLLVLSMALVSLAQKVRSGVIYYDGGYQIEEGEFGILPPPLASQGKASELVILNGAEPRVSAPFTGGGAKQSLLDLTAGSGGFSATWTDTRDGNMAIFLGFLDSKANNPIDGAAVHWPRTSRQFMPDIVMLDGAPGAKVAGAVTWTSQELVGQLAMVRFFETPKKKELETGERASGAFLSPAPYSLAPLNSRTPVQLVLEQEEGLAAWANAGMIIAKDIALNPGARRFHEEEAKVLVGRARPIRGAFEMTLNSKGRLLLAWSEKQPNGAAPSLMIAATKLESKRPVMPQMQGSGFVRGLAPDSSGGFWLLAERANGTLLEHFDSDGTSTRNFDPIVVTDAVIEDAQLTTWGLGDGVAVLLEERRENGDGRSKSGAITLHVFTPSGRRLTPIQGFDALDKNAVNARDAKIAAIGTSFLVAWTDSRQDSADVFFRLIELANLSRPAKRWNQDEGTSNQVHASVGSNGETAIVAWEDGRRGSSQIFVRSLRTVKGEQLELGFEGPLSPGPVNAQVYPSVAKARNGQAFITWKQQDSPGEWSVFGQLIGPDGQPKGQAFALDPGHTAPRKFAAASLALPNDGGYLVAWVRQGDQQGAGPQIARLNERGQLAEGPRSLTPRGAKDAQNLSLALGDKGSVLAVWDQIGLSLSLQSPRTAIEAKRILSGRLTTPLGSPIGKILSFPPSPEGGDFDPDVASVLGGGFLLAWCGNAGPSRDVFARFLSPRGQLHGPPLAISVRANEQDYPEVQRLPDGRMFVAWEDDISGNDHGFIREIKSVRGPAGRRAKLGPRLLVDTTDSVSVEDRYAPLLVALDHGLLMVWGDLGRGKGHDIAARFWLPK